MTPVAPLERDVQLMLRVREGDPQSFALLLQRHRAPVIRFLFRMVQNRAVAEELAQEVFLRVYASRKRYQPSARFPTWLFRIATRLALNSLRDGKKDRRHESLDQETGDALVPQAADTSPSVEQDLLRRDRLREIRLAIEALPAKQRAAVLMHKYEEMDYAHIAEALQCSESAVKSLLFRAYETLRARLAHMA